MNRKLGVLAVVVLACVLAYLMPAEAALLFNSSPPPPAEPIVVTVDPVGTVNARTGTATVSGAVTCNGVIQYVSLNLTLRQKQGRSIVQADSYVRLPQPCAWQTVRWQAAMRSDQGAFKGGAAEVLAYWSAYNPDPYVSYSGSSATIVQLSSANHQ